MSNRKNAPFDRIVFEKGNRRDGFIDVATTPTGAYVSIPVIEISGSEEGPLLLVDSCTHGDEYEGSVAVIRAAKQLESMDFKGTFIGIPALNMDAYSANTRSSTVDLTNLNRIYPGDTNKFITQRVAAKYFEKLVGIADYIISFHGGGTALHLEPIAGYIAPNDELMLITREMAKAFGTDYIWRLRNLPFTGTASSEIAKLGIPLILPEVGSHCGRLYDWEKNVDICELGVINTMKHIGMLYGEPCCNDEDSASNSDPIDIELQYIHTNDGGRHHRLVNPNDTVKKGDILAQIEDVFGNVISEIIAIDDSIVIGFCSNPVIKPGEWSFLMGKIIS